MPPDVCHSFNCTLMDFNTIILKNFVCEQMIRISRLTWAKTISGPGGPDILFQRQNHDSFSKRDQGLVDDMIFHDTHLDTSSL